MSERTQIEKDVLALADAVNQLAMVVEEALYLYVDAPAPLRARLVRERERVAPIIERLDP